MIWVPIRKRWLSSCPITILGEEWRNEEVAQPPIAFRHRMWGFPDRYWTLTSKSSGVIKCKHIRPLLDAPKKTIKKYRICHEFLSGFLTWLSVEDVWGLEFTVQRIYHSFSVVVSICGCHTSATWWWMVGIYHLPTVASPHVFSFVSKAPNIPLYPQQSLCVKKILYIAVKEKLQQHQQKRETRHACVLQSARKHLDSLGRVSFGDEKMCSSTIHGRLYCRRADNKHQVWRTEQSRVG